ncbi:hypothetical protein [Planctomyces sp. SH-PL62]|uniref:hypothetical protein n=1 Tax=Planctomyces sp. SH-PL62 TaxID=1636152 RepID=UPI00078C1C3C|nr:hypothetical protein [Planctomyces sp. SH-PL62]AMV39765.1 hypothetical protein VT85_20195 [Planctomyces sp. SH-PL62]
MVYRRFGLWSLALGVLIGSGSSATQAAPLNLTGYVEKDFAESNGNAKTGKVHVEQVTSSPTTIGQSNWISQNGWVSGWNVKDIRFSYSTAGDSLAVGFNTWANGSGQYAPFGQANGDPSGTATAYDPAHLGAGTPTSDKSFALLIAREDPNNPGTPGEVVAIAGVPADKSLNGQGTNGFTVANVDLSRSSGGLAYMFGTPLDNNKHLGNLAFDPSPSHPQLEFTIANFKGLIDPSKGFWVMAYAGSGLDGVAGETYMGWRHIAPLGEQGIPEPATVLAWTLVVGGLAWRTRSRRKVDA